MVNGVRSSLGGFYLRGSVASQFRVPIDVADIDVVFQFVPSLKYSLRCDSILKDLFPPDPFEMIFSQHSLHKVFKGWRYIIDVSVKSRRCAIQ